LHPHLLRPGPRGDCRRLPAAARSHSPTRGNDRNPRAWSGDGLCGGSRFLEFPIQMGVAETAHLRRTRPAHAPTHNSVGGYMRGERKEVMGEQIQGTQRLITGTAATVARPTTAPCGACNLALRRSIGALCATGARAARLVRAPPR
jgi:hypothetical protein